MMSKLRPDTRAGYLVLGVVVVVVGGLLLYALIGGDDGPNPPPQQTNVISTPSVPTTPGGTDRGVTNGPPPVQSTTLAALVENGAARQDAALPPADGISQTGTFQLGNQMLPNVVRFAVYPDDPQRVKTVQVPLGARFKRISGTFGIDRSHTPCTSGSASLTITDDAGNPIWPEGNAPASVSGGEAVPVTGDVAAVGQLVLVFSSAVPKGDCADSNQEVDVGLTLSFDGN